ncbi:hypothetical protein N8737_04980 [Verrucomicrobia bacterium]|nr:hypothetical protein [Verrucomicrobiota bacterium]
MGKHRVPRLIDSDKNLGLSEALSPHQGAIKDMCPESATRKTKKGGLRQQDRYTRDNILVFLRAIALGMKQGAAATLIGTSAETICRWKQTYPDFGESVEKATSLNQLLLLDFVYSGIPKNPRLALELLERIHPKEFGRVKRVVFGVSTARTCGPIEKLATFQNTTK